MFGVSGNFRADRLGQMERAPRDDHAFMRLADFFGFPRAQIGGGRYSRMRRPGEPAQPAAPPESQATDIPGAPTAPAQAMEPPRFANPFMPITNQPVTFGSMLSRQPNYN